MTETEVEFLFWIVIILLGLAAYGIVCWAIMVTVYNAKKGRKVK